LTKGNFPTTGSEEMAMMISENPRIGFIGFGAVAYYMSKGLKGAGIKQIKVVDLPTCNVLLSSENVTLIVL
jgi:hypothetical protein